jgi:hypothetical protein
MLIVLSNLTEGKAMTVEERVDSKGANETRIAAAVEAAYILEAVRK